MIWPGNDGKMMGFFLDQLCKVGSPCTIAFSWGSHNSNVTMVYGTYNELVFMGFINHLITGGAHIVGVLIEVHISEFCSRLTAGFMVYL